MSPVMSRARAAGRLVRLAGLLGTRYVALRRAQRHAKRDLAARRRIGTEHFQAFATRCLEVIGARVDVSGRPPTGPGLLVSNHVSHVDILVLASLARPVFVAKAEVARWPLIGHLARTVGTVFVERAHRRTLPRMLEELEAAVEAGPRVVLFPEGRTTDGERVLPFRPALLEVAARTGCEVHPVALRYRTGPGMPPARSAIAWWADTTLAGHAWRLLQLPEFSVRVTFGAAPLCGRERKPLARRLHAAVSEMWNDDAQGAPAPRSVRGGQRVP